MKLFNQYLTKIFILGCPILLFRCDGPSITSMDSQNGSVDRKADRDTKNQDQEAAAAKPGAKGAAAVVTKEPTSGTAAQKPGSASDAPPTVSGGDAQGNPGPADIPQPPENITGMYLACNLPLATATGVGINCRVEKNGVKTDDPLLLATGVWRFKSSNEGLVAPIITKTPNGPASSPDSHVSYVFEGITALSTTDLQNSSIELEYTYGGQYKGILTTSYRPDCKTYKVQTEVCTVRDNAAINGIQRVSFLSLQSTPPSIRYDWVYTIGPAKGILVVRGAPGSDTVNFNPTDGMQYTPGTLINNERIFLMGAETSKIDYDIVLNTRYTVMTCTFDELHTYTKQCLIMSYVPGI